MDLIVWASMLCFFINFLLLLTDENEERSMVEPMSLENPKVKELQEVNYSIVNI